MRYLFITIMLLCSFVLWAQSFNVNTPEGSVSMTINGVQTNGTTTSGNLIDQIGKKMEQLEKEIHVKLSKIDQKKAESIMNEIYGLLALLPANQSINISQTVSANSATTTTPAGSVNINITGMNPVATETEPVQEKPKPVKVTEDPVLTTSTRKAMPETEFNSLLNRIKGESFSDDQMRVLRTAAKNFRFSCNQIVRLIDAFTYSEDKLSALGITYPECTDPQNNYKILDAFTYSADKEAAEDIFNQ
jgi:hypothetical protein